MISKTPYAFILFVAFAALPMVCAQKPSDEKPCEKSVVTAHDIYKPASEWDVTLIDTSKVLSKEFPIKTQKPAYIGVTSVELGLKSHLFTFQKFRSDSCSGDVTIEKSQISVTHVIAIKKEGRIFAYLLYGGIRRLVNGEWQPCACSEEVTVYDPDGKGIFSRLIPFTWGLPYLPEWVRDGTR